MPRFATIILALTICGCGALNAGILLLALLHPLALNSDFMAFWSFPRFVAGHPAGQIYNAAALQGFQKAIYPGFGSFYPYLYPPTLLLAIGWLKFLPFRAAFIVWTVAGVALFGAAALWFFRRRRWLVLAAMLASPAALLCGVTGETAFFTSALLLAGFAALPKQKVLAGIAFGLLTLKPQLGVLIPILLLARGEWRAIITAAVTACLLVALSCAVFPPGMWLLWAHTLPAYQTQYFTAGGLNLNIIVTPAANLVALGAAPGLAWAAQLLCTVAVAALVWVAARRGDDGLAVAALLVGSFLAVPHAYAYDSITLTAAMALSIGLGVSRGEALLFCLVYVAPLLLLTPAHKVFLYALPEGLVFARIVMRCLRK